MRVYKIEEMLRKWGANGLYKGFWPLIEILEQMQVGISFYVALQSTAVKWEVSDSVMRKRVETLLSRMKRERTEEFVAVFEDADDLKMKAMVERMAAMLPGGYIQ